MAEDCGRARRLPRCLARRSQIERDFSSDTNGADPTESAPSSCAITARRRPIVERSTGRYVLAVGANQLVSNLVSSLAWPAAAIVLGFMFRHRIGRLIDQLAERIDLITYPAGSIRLRAKAAATKDLAKAANPNVPTTMDVPINSGPPRQRDSEGAERGAPAEPVRLANRSLATLLEMAKVSPTQAVQDAWQMVVSLLERTGVYGGLGVDTPAAFDRLQMAGHLSREMFEVARRLTDLFFTLGVTRQGQPENIAAARDFVQAAWRLAAEIATIPPDAMRPADAMSPVLDA